MADIAKINGQNNADVVEINTRTDVHYWNGHNWILDSVSLSQNSISIQAGSSDSVTVTSSDTWSANKTLDPDNIVSSYTLSGNTGESLTVTMNIKDEGIYSDATIEVTVGTATDTLTVSVIV